MTTVSIKAEATRLLQRKRPLSYEQIVAEIHRRHPEAKTTVRTVHWYASRLRRGGSEVRVRTQRKLAS